MAGHEGQTKALARRATDAIAGVDFGTRTPDAYEEKYMKGEGMVLYRDKAKMPTVITAAMGVGLVGMAASLLPLSLPLALGMGALTFLAWTTMTVLRVTVSEGNVNIKFGMFGPEIPLDSIEAVERYDYRWIRYGGWGIRLGPGGEWMYNMPGDQGRAVRIRWRTAKGRSRTTCIGSKDADRIYAAIRSGVEARARAGLTKQPKMLVSSSPSAG